MAAVLSGAIAYFFNKRMRLSATQHALIRIVAANSDLPSGVTLGNKDITTIEWPSALPLPGSFTKVEDVVGRPLIYPLGAKEPVLKRDLGVEGSGIGLSAKIPAGMRATAVRSNEIVGVAGFLFPGSHVDVLATYAVPGIPGSQGPTSPGTATQTVLQNVEVLTAGTATQTHPQSQAQTNDVV